MAGSLTELSARRFGRAREELQTAELLMKSGSYRQSISRGASELREQADYEDFYSATKDDAESVLESARRLIDMVGKFLAENRVI